MSLVCHTLRLEDSLPITYQGVLAPMASYLCMGTVLTGPHLRLEIILILHQGTRHCGSLLYVTSLCMNIGKTPDDHLSSVRLIALVEGKIDSSPALEYGERGMRRVGPQIDI